MILAAGQGVRLRAEAPYKPLVAIGGRPLIAHVLTRLAAAGATEALLVLGYGGDAVRAALGDPPLPLRFIDNPDWAAPNGVSLRAAGPWLAERALLTMADHLVEPALYRALWRASLGSDGVGLGVDRRLGHPAVDEADVTRVVTRGDRIIGIGKGLGVYDCYDTGVFQITPALIEAVERSPRPSLSDGVGRLAREGRARAIDVTGLDWLDIDDARALRLAEVACEGTS